MDYDEITHLQSSHPAWMLLRSPHAPLVLSFLERVFVDTNASALPAGALVTELDDELFALNARSGDTPAYPRAPIEYLDDWAAPAKGWLRKFYPAGSDEAHYDLGPAVETALGWVQSLRPREFIGTESRLNTIFELLRQMVHGSDTDTDRRLDELRRQRTELDAAIARAERGEVDVLDDVALRDRYQQFARTARELLSDFRALEDNFRQLDRRLREQIAGWTGSKGELLDDVLTSRHSLAESDQGRSFGAFYSFLLSSDRRAELTDLLGRLGDIEALGEADSRLARIHFDWIDAGERTQATVRSLSEQLRRFLDDQVWIENRRVFDLLRGIESRALELRDLPAPAVATELDDLKVTVVLPFERPLYRSSRPEPLAGGAVEAGDGDFDSSALIDQIHVDREALVARVRRSLARQRQVALDDLVAGSPLEHGLAELIAYLAVREPDLDVVFDEDGRAQVSWSGDGPDRVADLPRVTYRRLDEELAR